MIKARLFPIMPIEATVNSIKPSTTYSNVTVMKI